MEPQRWGDFIAVETLSQTSLGTVYKALPVEGEPKLFYLKTFPPAVASRSQAATLLQTHGARWQALRDLYTLHLDSLGQAGDHFLATFEYRQGRLLSDILDRAAKEGIPLAPDQAVYLAERIAGALLSLSTQDQYAGALCPEDVLVTFEGEVKLFPSLGRDLATTDLRAEGILEPLLAYQPDDVRGGKKAKAAADRFALGALFFEFLTHQPLRPEGQEADVAARLQEAKGGLGMGDPLPAKLSTILEKALLPGTPGAYENIDAFKADLDELITSGEYSPSTFNMAFLMHTLFRDEDEAEAAKDQGWLAMDRSPFLTPAAPPEPEAAPEPPKPKKRMYVPPPVQEPATPEPSFAVEEEPSRKGLWISLGATVVVVVIAVLSYLAFGRKSGPSQEEIQAQIDARVAAERANIQKEQQELATKLEAAQKEKEALEQQASQARTADEKAKAQKALEETQRKIEAQKQEQAALNQKAATAAAGATPPHTAPAEPPKAPPTSTSTPPPVTPSPQPATTPSEPATVQPEPAAAVPAASAGVKAGDFVEIFAVDVKPKEVQGLKVEYTPQARKNALRGTVYLEVDIDETGSVTGARAVRAPSPDYGMKDALVAAATKMRFTPAIKEGVPVKTKLTFPVRMEIK